MKVGLFFGSFNPIHIGHLVIAESMLDLAGLDRVWFVVSPQNPFKRQNSLLHEFDRYDMVKLAIEGNPRLGVTDIEFGMPKPSYTVDTLTFLRELYPSYEFSLMMGEDNLTHFPKWKNYEEIINNHNVLVYPRPGETNSPLLDGEAIKLIEAPMMNVSATLIRKKVKADQSLKYLVEDKVAEYIDKKGFYL